MFADLVGSTALAGSQDPERTRVVLDRFYDAMAQEIERAGGTIEKFAGDAVMAAFGAPSALEDHAERALYAALAMQRRLVELFEGQVALRIGVNTGDVIVGRARAGSSFVSGDAVNVAARLEQAAAPGAIFVGERTAAAARGAFEFDQPQTVEAKGKPKGVVARRLVRTMGWRRYLVDLDDGRGRAGGVASARQPWHSSVELIKAVDQPAGFGPSDSDEDVEHVHEWPCEFVVLEHFAMAGQVALDDPHDRADRQRLVLVAVVAAGDDGCSDQAEDAGRILVDAPLVSAGNWNCERRRRSGWLIRPVTVLCL
jgi:class 3 adenylate cyclase